MTDDQSKRNRVNQTDLNLLIKKTKNVINSLLLAQAFHLGLSFPMDVGSSILEKGCALSASPLCPCLYIRPSQTTPYWHFEGAESLILQLWCCQSIEYERIM